MMNNTARRLGVFLVLFALVAAATAATAGRKKTGEVTEELLARHPEIQQLREQVAASPDNAGLHNDLGNMYARQGWDALAMDEYLTAVRHDAGFYIAWTNLGTLHSKAGDLGKAARAFQTAIDVQPLAALAHYNLGVVRDRLGDYDGALESFKTAVSYDPRLLDPAVNPQIVNNKHETTIRLLKYLEEVGSSSLPLEDAPTTATDEDTMDSTDDAGMMMPSEDAPSTSQGPVLLDSETARRDSDPLSSSTTSPDGMTGGSVLGSLKMFTGRAERRLHRRADRESPSDDATPGSAPGTTANNLSTP